MKIFFLVLLMVLLLLVAVGYVLFFVGVVRLKKNDRFMKTSPRLEQYAGRINEGIDWFRACAPTEVHITAYDGVPLCGLYLAHPEDRGTVILFHGYRSDPIRDFSCALKDYYDLGYSILTVYQRAHGRSGGAYICFGIKERFDCRDWARYVYDRRGAEHDIFLSGLSMGATTVLMAAGLTLPESVRGIVADCGFTSPADEFRHVLKRSFHLPVHPFMDIAGLFSRLFAGFGFSDYSTLLAMKTCTLPILFFHGEADQFVPSIFSRQNYEACAGEKKLILVPDAGHGFSYLLAPEECRDALRTFLSAHASRCEHEI